MPRIWILATAVMLVGAPRPALAIKTISRGKEEPSKPAAKEAKGPKTIKVQHVAPEPALKPVKPTPEPALKPVKPTPEPALKATPALQPSSASPPTPAAAGPPPPSANGLVTFSLADLAAAKSVTLAGPNTIVIEIKRSSMTSKATKVRVSVDGRTNKVLSLKDETTLHLITLTDGSHTLGFVAALGKRTDGQLIVRHKNTGAALVASESTASAPAAAHADVLNAPLVEVSGSAPVTIPKGSYLSAIAWQTYGSEGMWPVLYEVNRTIIGNDPNRVEEGSELFIPDSDAAKEIMAWIVAGRPNPRPLAFTDPGRGQRVVVRANKTYTPTQKKLKREIIALMPLHKGEAWTSLLAQLLDERKKEPLTPTTRQCLTVECYKEIAAAFGAKKLIGGGLAKEGDRYFLTLTLYDLATFEQVNEIERTWKKREPLDSGLGAALDDLLGPPKKKKLVAPPPPIAAVAQSAAPTVSDHRYRPYGYGFLIGGGALIVAGGATLTANRAMASALDRDAAAYNAQLVRTDAQFQAIDRRRQTQVGLGVAAYVGIGVGAAALATGIVLFVLDGKREPTVTLVPTGPGAAVVGSF